MRNTVKARLSKSKRNISSSQTNLALWKTMKPFWEIEAILRTRLVLKLTKASLVTLIKPKEINRKLPTEKEARMDRRKTIWKIKRQRRKTGIWTTNISSSNFKITATQLWAWNRIWTVSYIILARHLILFQCLKVLFKRMKMRQKSMQNTVKIKRLPKVWYILIRINTSSSMKKI